MSAYQLRTALQAWSSIVKFKLFFCASSRQHGVVPRMWLPQHIEGSRQTSNKLHGPLECLPKHPAQVYQVALAVVSINPKLLTKLCL